MDSEYTIYIISAAAFVSVIALIDALYVYWRGVNLPGRRKVDKRLQELYAGGIDRAEALELLRTQKMSSNETLDSVYSSIPRLVALNRLIEQSGLHLSVSGFLALQATLSAGLFLLLYVTTHINLYAVIFISIVVGCYIPYFIVKGKRNQRNALFNVQLPEAMDFISRSLRAGNPFTATIKQVSQEMPEPIASEFGITFDELNFGLELNHALHGLHERTQSDAIRYFVTAVLLQRDTGGNLAEVLNRISGIIRDKFTTKKEIKILSAEMKQSANILLLLPFIVAGIVSIMNPKYLLPLIESPQGYFIIGVQCVLMIIGYIIIQKMVNFRI